MEQALEDDEDDDLGVVVKSSELRRCRSRGVSDARWNSLGQDEDLSSLDLGCSGDEEDEEKVEE